MILTIVAYPNKILKTRTKKIANPCNSEIKELILDMLETMKKNNGVGLAANQVGQSLQLAVVKILEKTYILINPKIKSKSWKKIVEDEGCLSFPGLQIPVKRHAKIRVTAQNKAGKAYEIKAEGLLSRVLQHEIDHLNGIPFTKRMAKINLKKIITHGANKK